MPTYNSFSLGPLEVFLLERQAHRELWYKFELAVRFSHVILAIQAPVCSPPLLQSSDINLPVRKRFHLQCRVPSSEYYVRVAQRLYHSIPFPKKFSDASSLPRVLSGQDRADRVSCWLKGPRSVLRHLVSFVCQDQSHGLTMLLIHLYNFSLPENLASHFRSDLDIGVLETIALPITFRISHSAKPTEPAMSMRWRSLVVFRAECTSKWPQSLLLLQFSPMRNMHARVKTSFWWTGTPTKGLG